MKYLLNSVCDYWNYSLVAHPVDHMSNEALYAELLGSEAWIITNFSNPFFSKNNFLFRTLLSASLKLNAEGSLVSLDRKSTRLNSSHSTLSRMPSSA